MQKWEYESVTITNVPGVPSVSTMEECNKLGDQGWELVSVVPETEEKFETLYFKRPAQEKRNKAFDMSKVVIK